MGWTTFCARRWVLAVLLALGVARGADAIYLDEDQHVSLRARVYSQGTVRIEDSEIGPPMTVNTPMGPVQRRFAETIPVTKSGQLVQHRNFFNPELEAKLTSYTSWMHGPSLAPMAPDESSSALPGSP